MWGWKTVERHIDSSVSLDEARDILAREGFEERVGNPGHRIFNKSGTDLTVSAEKVTLELALAEADSGLFLQLRYDTFVLFDTGDLDQVADGIVAKLRSGSP